MIKKGTFLGHREAKLMVSIGDTTHWGHHAYKHGVNTHWSHHVFKHGKTNVCCHHAYKHSTVVILCYPLLIHNQYIYDLLYTILNKV